MTEYTDVPVVYIQWKDHFSVNGNWIEMNSITNSPDFLMIQTVGYLLAETDEAYKVGLSVSDEGLVSGNVIILKATVVEYKELHVNDRMGKRKKTD